MPKFVSEYDALNSYDEMLDEVYEDIQIAGSSYGTSYALKEIDPIAYRVGFLDWLDSEELTTDESEADDDEGEED